MFKLCASNQLQLSNLLVIISMHACVMVTFDESVVDQSGLRADLAGSARKMNWILLRCSVDVVLLL